jgi:hypothetical protein
MSLFTQSTLSAAWRTRSSELSARTLQPYNDILYEVLVANFESRRDELQAEILKVIQSASSLRDLSIPLWSYKTTIYQESRKVLAKLPSFQPMEERMRRRGYHCTVGTVPETFDPETVETNDSEYGWTYSWDTAPVSVGKVIRGTDLCHRLALLFGDSFRVESRLIATKRLTDPFPTTILHSELWLNYYPRGLLACVHTAQAAVRQKYEEYTAPVRAAWVVPYVWEGVPSTVRRMEGTLTPPPSPRPPSPPPLIRAVRLNPEEEDEVLIPCYCGYHHEEPPEPEDE